MGRAAFIGEQVLQLDLLVGGPVPDDVVAAVAGAQIVVGAGDRIAQALLSRREAERHVVEQLAMNRRWKRRLRNQRAPGHIAGIKRDKVGQTLLANGGAKAVRADQQFALGGAAVGEVGGYRPLGLRETPDAAATVIALRRKRIPQRPIDPLPRSQHLGTREFVRQPT